MFTALCSPLVSDDGRDIIRLDQKEERRLSAARWQGSSAATVHVSMCRPLRTAVKLWRSHSMFPGKGAQLSR